MVDTDRNDKVRKAYGMAAAQLRTAHLDEFNKYQSEAAEKLGIDWHPRPTKEQKAREMLAQLLRENPDLKGEVVDEVRKQIAEGDGKPAVAEVPSAPEADTA